MLPNNFPSVILNFNFGIIRGKIVVSFNTITKIYCTTVCSSKYNILKKVEEFGMQDDDDYDDDGMYKYGNEKLANKPIKYF